MEMMNTRRKNKLDSVASQPFMKTGPSFDDLLFAFLIDCKHRSLSQRTIEFYEYSLQQMNNSFIEKNQTLNPLAAYSGKVGQSIRKRLVSYSEKEWALNPKMFDHSFR